MSYSSLEAHLKENPQLEHVFWESMQTGDPWLLGVQKPPTDFTKYVLGRIKAANPQSEHMISNVQIPREI